MKYERLLSGRWRRFWVLVLGAIALVCADAGAGDEPAMTVGDGSADLIEQAFLLFGNLPASMPGAEADTPELVALGEKLYFSNELSVTRSQSCNTCHPIDGGRAGADNLPTSPGAHGKLGTRNSPTVLNSGYQVAQFWDGRAKDLVEQAKGPILNPVEMAMPDAATVETRVKADAELSAAYSAAFPMAGGTVTYDEVARAIAAFERTLKSESRLDEYMRGDADAITEQEKRGLDAFIGTGCIQCHNGPLVGGTTFQKFGRMNPYPTEDLGRFDVTQDEESKHVFKVPQLRNVGLTGPYFHNGTMETLEEAVKTMAWIQLNVKLDDAKVEDITAFLRTLSDPEREPAVSAKSTE